MNRYFKMGLINVVFLSLLACSSEEGKNKTRLATAKLSAHSTVLYYSGTIKPLKTIVVPSPAEGVIVEMPFQYGEQVKQDQLLFEVSSAKFLTDYKAALMQYVKAKSDFNTAKSQLAEGKFLHQNQLISDDDFKMKQSTYYTAQLSLVQAKDALESLTHQLAIKDMNFYNLTIADVDKITKAMHLQMNADENLKIRASANGIILSPLKNDDETKKIGKGDVVKQGDVLAVIGDMSGVKVRINVNEMTINQLQPGQKVKVTGIAFPYVLSGIVEQVDKQGNINSSGIPTFSADIKVPHLSKAQQQDIHVGMSAKVEIVIDEKAQLQIPVNAVYEKDGASFVKAIDSKTKKTKEVAIQVGNTTLDAVVVLTGIKAGDQVLIAD